jgi:hypothetical protein
MNHRFQIGDRVRVIGILATFYSEQTGIVIGVEPSREGIPELDRYQVEMPGVKVGDWEFADFQLAPAKF